MIIFRLIDYWSWENLSMISLVNLNPGCQDKLTWELRKKFAILNFVESLDRAQQFNSVRFFLWLTLSKAVNSIFVHKPFSVLDFVLIMLVLWLNSKFESLRQEKPLDRQIFNIIVERD